MTEIAALVPHMQQPPCTGLEGHRVQPARQYSEDRGRPCPFQQRRNWKRRGEVTCPGSHSTKTRGQTSLPLPATPVGNLADEPGQSRPLPLLTSPQIPGATSCWTQNAGHRGEGREVLD